MNTNEYFESLLERINLKIDDNQRKNIEEKQNKLREALRQELPLKDDFLTGSYRRHTIIKPKSGSNKFDVDIFVAFDNASYGEKELGDLRKMVYAALEKIKGNNSALGITEVSDSQRRSVCVSFGSNFQIDVVPSLEIEKDKLYKIYDRRTLKPVRSNPKLHAKLLSEANDRTGGKLVPIIKMIKSWKRDKCDYAKSFHLELLAVDILGNSEISSYAEGLAKFFTEAISKLEKPNLKDPANNDNYIDAYLDEDNTRVRLLGLVSAEARIASDAVRAEKANESGAVSKWQGIFDNQQLETAEAIRSGKFFTSGGGIRVGGNGAGDGKTINAPRSWGT